MALRQYDVVLADGRFRIVLTDRRRLFAVLDAPETALGPLRVAFEIDRRSASERTQHVVSGAPESSRNGVLPGEQAFETASTLAPRIAPPAFALLNDSATRGAKILHAQIPRLPASARGPIEAAARIVLRARLGDLAAKRFIQRVLAGVRTDSGEAHALRSALIEGHRLVLEMIGTNTDPFRRFTGVLERGDFHAVRSLVADGSTRAQERERETVDDFVKLFAEAAQAPAYDDGDLADDGDEVSGLPAVRGPSTTVGFGVGGAIGIAAEAASGNVAGAAADTGSALGGNLAKGAAIGSAIGSVIPGLGTAIGGAVGAVIGGIGSLFGHHHHGPLDYERMSGGLGTKMARHIAEKIRSAPRWQAHFQAIYRHLPAGTANVKGLGDLVAHELFPHDEYGKDATTGHADGLAEWFAEQPDWETLLHSNGVPPGDRHQLEARIHAAKNRRDDARKAWDALQHRAPRTSVAPPRPPPAQPELLSTWEPIAALPVTTGCACDPEPGGAS